jgi:hypothetical protein
MLSSWLSAEFGWLFTKPYKRRPLTLLVQIKKRLKLFWNYRKMLLNNLDASGFGSLVPGPSVKTVNRLMSEEITSIVLAKLPSSESP